MSGILIVAEVDGVVVKPELGELVTLAGKIQESVGGDLVVGVVVGSGREVPRELEGWEIDAVHVLEGDGLGDPWPEAHSEALAQLCAELEPDVVLLAPTLLGQEVSSRLALRLNSSLIQGAMDVQLRDDGLFARRHIYGGAAVATVAAAVGRHVIVPRPGAYERAAPSTRSAIDVLRHTVSLSSTPKTRFTGLTRREGTVANIKAANVLVSGGSGIGGPEGFELLQEVADLLGGVVSASRPACDAGWVDSALQVGMTGKTVAPDLYLAVGISGAIQHLMGCASAKVIVAVNKDKDAPIFRASTLGVVGDWKEVMGGLRDALSAAAR
ncbi:hypothetical protein N864_00240 [Intrasporangium chromatireducens Q5-1]|uniref:Electron transfer flavoprotein alpha/beta-subunit N-terminal domain-containing protein n=1 Tax=Intrasporangium chromatireducens Q5-1 TaxID=584657 RepID=W9GMP2_9MICO|nr:electron transfer flavoprotein subunit alpha/FixB family protein [Intrasporangium chromatireducens]EWT06083.1 hypothetical protein N864_00240 [Intrasporangium chromatireducens Q5-1]